MRYTCEKCGKTFNSAFRFSLHKRIHDGVILDITLHFLTESNKISAGETIQMSVLSVRVLQERQSHHSHEEDTQHLSGGSQTSPGSHHHLRGSLDRHGMILEKSNETIVYVNYREIVKKI